jgi:hypothetical protein
MRSLSHAVGEGANRKFFPISRCSPAISRQHDLADGVVAQFGGVQVPALSRARLHGAQNVAVGPSPSMFPLSAPPAIVVTTPAGVILRIVLLPFSAT